MTKVIVLFKDGKIKEEEFERYDKACDVAQKMFGRFDNIKRVSVKCIEKNA